MQPMVTKNANGTYTVMGVLTCLSEAAALALLEDGDMGLDALTARASQPPRFSHETAPHDVSGLTVIAVDHAA